MRMKPHINRSNGKWWCFFGYFVGMGINPVQAWYDCDNAHIKFTESLKKKKNRARRTGVRHSQ